MATKGDVLLLRLATAETDEVANILSLAEAGDESAWTRFARLRTQIGHDDARRVQELIGNKLAQAKLYAAANG